MSRRKPMDDFSAICKEYVEKNEVFNALKKEVDGLKDRIKSTMVEYGIDEFLTDAGEKILLTERTKSVFDDDAAYAILGDKLSKDDLDRLFEVKHVMVDDVFESMTYSGVVKADDLSGCITNSVSYALTIKKNKKGDNVK